MAIIALVLTFVVPVVGLVLGIIALNQIKKTHEDGRVLAIVAIVINAIQLLIFVVAMVFVVVISENFDIETTIEDFEQEQVELDASL